MLHYVWRAAANAVRSVLRRTAAISFECPAVGIE